MSRRVYPWPAALPAAKLDYGDPNRARTTPRWDDSPGQTVAEVQRTRLTISGPVYPDMAADFEVLRDRIRGGEHLVALIDFAMRARFGWNMTPALAAGGDEFWRADGQTGAYAGEAANPPTGPWRSIFAEVVGTAAAGALSIDVDGLLAGEVIPMGCMIRAGDFRHRLSAQATADGTGAATLALSSPLRAALSDNDPVRVPGDLFVGWRAAPPDVSPVDHRRMRTYAFTFAEAYESEVSGGFDWQL